MEAVKKGQRHQYSIQVKLGEGLTSDVYYALKFSPKERIGCPVVLKILKSKNLLDSWQSELESYRLQNNEYTFKLVDFDWINSCPCLVLEYLPCVSLKALVLELNEIEKCYIYSLIETTIFNLHQRTWCHGDLQMSNILFTLDAGLKFIDFGKANNNKSNLLLKAIGTNLSLQDKDLIMLGVLEGELCENSYSLNLSYNPQEVMEGIVMKINHYFLQTTGEKNKLLNNTGVDIASSTH